MIVVIGGGLMGITTAHALSTRGHQVTLIDQAGQLATGTSYANGGQLSWAHIDPLASPGLLLKLPAILLGMDAAIGLRALPSPRLIGWGLNFIGQCRPGREKTNLEKLFKLSMFSRGALHELNHQYALSYHHQTNGKLVLFSTQQALAAARKNKRFRDSLGCRTEMLTADECIALEPAATSMHHRITGGLYSAMDESGDSQLFCTQLAEQCRQQGRVRFDLNCRAERIITQNNSAIGIATSQGDITADHVIIAAGMESLTLARSAGLRLPLLPVKGYSLSLPLRRQGAPTLSITDIKHKMVYSRLGEQLRIAGIHQIGSGDTKIYQRKINQLLGIAQKCFPDAADYGADPCGWAGLRPTTPDSVPIIGQTPVRNLWLNTGQGMLGWTLACGSAELLARLMYQEQSSLRADDYSLQRF